MARLRRLKRRDGKPFALMVRDLAMLRSWCEVEDAAAVGHVARSFDSCLVCTVHAHDARTGKKLARFRVA